MAWSALIYWRQLSTGKSYWYLINFQWRQGAWQCKNNQRITRLPLASRESCSHWKSGTLNALRSPQDPVLPRWKHVWWSQVFAQESGNLDQMHSNRLCSKEMVWYCLNATIMMTIEYPLTGTTFSWQETQQFIKPLLKVALNSFGIQRRLPTALMYSTLRARGLGIQNP